MKISNNKIDKMIQQLNEIYKKAKKLETRYAYELSGIKKVYLKSAQNLLHYLALRHTDINDLQDRLAQVGVSRLGKAESHVLASVVAVKSILKHLNKSKKFSAEKTDISIRQGNKIISANTTALLGKKLKGSKVRIMVTLPTEAAFDKKMVYELLMAGMNCARINCAHDNEDIWKAMIDNIKKAKKKTGRNCKICMDLGGPKLRTGALLPGPQVIHLQPQRDALGKVLAPAIVQFAPLENKSPAETAPSLQLPGEWLRQQKNGDILRFRDARGKMRKLEIERTDNSTISAKCYDSAYLITGTKLIPHKTSNPTPGIIDFIAPLEQKILCRSGDRLIIHKDTRAGEPAQYDEQGNLLKTAHVSCSLPEIFQDVRVGEMILLDDGKIEGIIRSVTEDELNIEITYAKEEGAKLKADKGINFPESHLRLKGLTAKDKKDLKFIAKYADIVNMSFVNDPNDVLDLLKELTALDAQRLGIILKIETKRGFENLPGILLTAMQRFPLGVMIARGDLAIEGGWNNLAQLQEEILWLCEAAHVPIVWATQVLETLAKKGRPSRAEISDVSLAQRAECVMLNKGPHIVDAIRLLDNVLHSMQIYHQKQAPLLPLVTTEDYLRL